MEPNTASVTVLETPVAGIAGVSRYTIDPAHSSAQFSVRHLMISNVKGEFSNVSGTVLYDPDNLAASQVEAVIDASTISTRDEQRDAHLKSADFFDTANHSTLTFKSRRFRKNSGNLEVVGDLTMRGVTKEVVLTVDGPSSEVKDPWGNTRFGATATTTVNRKDWGLNWNQALETGGILVGEEVKITLELQAVRDAEAAGQLSGSLLV
jgi:polyisoprenoid-binding protein YceI